MPETSFCVLCPDRRRIPYQGLVCEPCRRWLAWMIGDVRDYASQLAATPDLVPDERVLPAPFGPRLRSWHDLDDNRAVRRRDYLSALLPSASSGRRSGGGPVSGSRNPPIPINVDAVDILMPPRQGSVPATVVPASVVDTVPAERRYVRLADGEPEYVAEYVTGTRRLTLFDPDGLPLYVDAHDQIGYLPLVASLDGWVHSWREARNAGEGLPDAHIVDMCHWLHSRVEWACDVYEPVVDFADEIRAYRSAMANILGLVDVPDYKFGVPCPKCNSLTLFRKIGGNTDSTGLPIQDGSLWVECKTCPAMLSPEEYEEWTKARVEAVRESADTPMNDLAEPQVASSATQ